MMKPLNPQDTGAGRFASVAIHPKNPRWETSVARRRTIYGRTDDIRSEFARDYTRILHCTAYRRLKHKTQVFFATNNDHICTRMEHVNHVASVSYTIASYLGLNTELTNAISIGHDLGHAPFGHAGEEILKDITSRELGIAFWHEKNSLRFVDCIETLRNPDDMEENLLLTYAVRDGIISHCGEVDEQALFPREEAIELESITAPNEFAPYTWEGCVVKIADKIAYLGRDIEDALRLKILTVRQKNELKKLAKVDLTEINNTVLMHNLIIDLITRSSPQNGISFSMEYLDFINRVKEFNYKNIYQHKRLKHYKDYAALIIHGVYDTLKGCYSGRKTFGALKEIAEYYPTLGRHFTSWLCKYSDLNDRSQPDNRFANRVLYRIVDNSDAERIYRQAIIDFIAGMTDQFASKAFGELISF